MNTTQVVEEFYDEVTFFIVCVIANKNDTHGWYIKIKHI